MSNVTIKAGLLPALDSALSAVLALAPPPTPKGRYALAKAGQAVSPAAALYNTQKNALIEQHGKKGEDGKLLAPTVGTDSAGRQIATYQLVDAAAFQNDLQAIADEDITLTGVRAITHAELGECPITGAQESVLLGVLLTDEEPV